MKKNITYFLLAATMLLSYQSTEAQKYDRHWLADTLIPNSGGGGTTTYLQFNEDGIDYIIDEEPNSSTISVWKGPFAMSNAAGELQFCTNGRVIVSRDNNVMEGGYTLNLDSPYWWQSPPDSSTAPYQHYAYQAIPDPYDGDIFYLIYSAWEAFEAAQGSTLYPCWWAYSRGLQICKIDMSANGGMGKVLYKDRFLTHGHMHLAFNIIRHGNGKDWWLVEHAPRGSSYRASLLHSDSIVEVVHSQITELDSTSLDCEDIFRSMDENISASPDGSKLMKIYNNRGYALLLDFDRCSGVVSLNDTINVGFNMQPIVSGSVDSFNYGCIRFQISPSGRFLYGLGFGEISQWDLEAEDIAASKVVLGFPGPVSELQEPIEGHVALPVMLTLGPDGKIYHLVGTTHNVIHSPDEPGYASDACFAYETPPSCLPPTPFFGVSVFSPIYPNYRLGALTGSGCDTLSSSTGAVPAGEGYGLRLSPNPSSSYVQVEISLSSYDEDGADIEVYDMLGREVYHHRLAAYAYLHSIDVSEWSVGVYTVLLRHKGRLQSVAKLVVE